MPKARQTCTECSVRRQRCDRNVPCARCQARGIAHLCTRVWPDANASRAHRGASRQTSQTVLSVSTADRDDAGPVASNRLQNQTSPQQTQSQSASLHFLGEREETNDELSETGGLAASDPADKTYLPPRATGVCQDASHGTDLTEFDGMLQSIATSGFPDIRATSLAVLELHLPSVARIWHLVDYHEKYLLWYHGCYHGPTFRASLEDALERDDDCLPLRELNLQWVALLFSIMAGSMACASESMLSSWGFCIGECSSLARQWYQATLTCLNLSGYTRDLNILSVHAITTLSMSAHPLGFSEELVVILGSALRIAQSLGLNRLDCRTGSEVIEESSTDQQRDRVLQREIGRRLWSQLCVQDWFSLPSNGSQCISPHDFTTIKPSNRDHVTMAPIDEAYPTYISYGNYLNDIAKLMAEHHVAMAQSSTPYTRYEQVLLYDKRMRNLAKEIPKYFSVTTPIDPSWPVFIPWARRSLTICFAHKIIMIHRTFIRMSFSNPAFQVTRNTCIAAAKTILKEARQEPDEEGPIIWIDQAFCVAAGLVLCLDIMHRSKGDPARAIHRSLTEECVARLQKFQGSTVAVQGAHLLLGLLAEEEGMTRPIDSTRKRGTAADDRSERKRRLLNAGKMLSMSNQGHDYSADQPSRPHPHVELASTADYRGESDQYTTTGTRLPQVLPLQAGFSDDFLFGELLDF